MSYKILTSVSLNKYFLPKNILFYYKLLANSGFAIHVVNYPMFL